MANDPNRLTLTLLSTALLLTGCGGSSSSTPATTTVSPTVTLHGSAIAGAVTGEVVVSDPSGRLLLNGSVVDGRFTLPLTAEQCGSELNFSVTGHYTDESSGATVALTESTPLTARTAVDSLDCSGSPTLGITPQTTLVRQLAVERGLTLDQAEQQISTQLGIQPTLYASPFDPTQTPPDSATDADRFASLLAATYSQWGHDLGLSGDTLATLPYLLARDLADGVLDGIGHEGNPVTLGTTTLQALHQQSPLVTRYLSAMARFIGSSHNGAALTAPTEGLPNQGISDLITPEQPAQRTVTLQTGASITARLWVDNEVPLPDQPQIARTRHWLQLTDANGLPVDITTWGGQAGLTAALQMQMLNGKNHSAPFTAQAMADSEPSTGRYRFDAYYLMASSMGMGSEQQPMGVWDFTFTLTEADGTPHEILFHPEVVTPSGDTLLRARVTTPDDPMMMNGTASPRPYLLWLQNITAATNGGYDLTLALTAMRTMQSFPLLTPGLSLAMMGSGAPTIEKIELYLDQDGDGVYETMLDSHSADGLFRATALPLTVENSTGLIPITTEIKLYLDEDGDTATPAKEVVLSGLNLKVPRP